MQPSKTARQLVKDISEVWAVLRATGLRDEYVMQSDLECCPFLAGKLVAVRAICFCHGVTLGNGERALWVD